MDQVSSISNRIKEYREIEGMTLSDLSKKTGVPAQTLNRYELGRRVPKLDIAVQIAEAIQVNPLWLQGYDVPMNGAIPKGFDRAPETYLVPRVGAIACGTPILAEQNIEAYDSVPTSIRCDFTLICKGDSMKGAGIEDGDVVYIRKQPEVENNEIAAVMIEGEATLKYFKRVGDVVLLSPANTDYEPIVLSGPGLKNVEVVGKAVGFTRIFDK